MSAAWPNWAFYFWAGAAVLAAAAVVLLYLGLWRDKDKGVRRCRRCWYDMSGTPGLMCPECGAAASKESRLFGRRRRWWLATLGVVLLLGAGPVALWPKIHRDGWWSITPRTVLIWMWPEKVPGWLIPHATGLVRATPSAVMTEVISEELEPFDRLWKWQRRAIARRCAEMILDRRNSYLGWDVLCKLGPDAAPAVPAMLKLRIANQLSGVPDTSSLARVSGDVARTWPNAPDTRALEQGLIGYLDDLPEVRNAVLPSVPSPFDSLADILLCGSTPSGSQVTALAQMLRHNPLLLPDPLVAGLCEHPVVGEGVLRSLGEIIRAEGRGPELVASKERAGALVVASPRAEIAVDAMLHHWQGGELAKDAEIEAILLLAQLGPRAAAAADSLRASEGIPLSPERQAARAAALYRINGTDSSAIETLAAVIQSHNGEEAIFGWRVVRRFRIWPARIRKIAVAAALDDDAPSQIMALLAMTDFVHNEPALADVAGRALLCNPVGARLAALAVLQAAGRDAACAQLARLREIAARDPDPMCRERAKALVDECAPPKR